MVTVEAHLLVKAKAIFDDEESNENTVRYLVEQDLEDVGYDVEVSLQSKSEDVAPPPKWFPTSEKLPNKGDIVLAFTARKKLTVCVYNGDCFKDDMQSYTENYIEWWTYIPPFPEDDNEYT